MGSVNDMAEPIQGVRYLWRFEIPDHEATAQISKTLGLPPLMAAILARRQITSAAKAREFLEPNLRNLPSPHQLPDIAKAVERIARALKRDEQIVVYGDYDVDGLTATAVLVQFISKLGGQVRWYVPHRVREGYGLNSEALRYFSREGVGLVITVDCGIGDHKEIQEARELGLDVVVTDHHQPPSILPEASALVNPKQGDGGKDHRDMAGVGVAFYLATALRAHLRGSGRWRTSNEPNLKAYLDLVAIGTLADMAPLTSTNRILASIGLEVLARTPRAGLRALKEICGLQESRVSEGDVLFRLGPRLNAAGRLGSADLSLRLLLSSDLEKARLLARELDKSNARRQAAEEKLFAEASDAIEGDGSAHESRSLVLASSGWPKGLLGLVASRLAERFGKPTILLTRADQGWEGSGRSRDPFDLYQALDSCKQHLVRFGGHRLAAGVALTHQQLGVFRSAFEKIAQEKLIHGGIPQSWPVDVLARLEEITPALMAYLDQLRPFGEGNPEPTFYCEDFRVENPRVLKDKHLKMTLRQGKVRFDAIGFNLVRSNRPPPIPKRLLYSPAWNYWRGEKRIQLQILDYC
ncbi:MAG: single-stranded-DNA-specific exonuclease RecJ [Deltaproteobacteria bacterium]|nr:MAG: single-stranded-DNA-specific exonuclease RecJ [Deltaproteobacteria bacterium]